MKRPRWFHYLFRNFLIEFIPNQKSNISEALFPLLLILLLFNNIRHTRPRAYETQTWWNRTNTAMHSQNTGKRANAFTVLCAMHTHSLTHIDIHVTYTRAQTYHSRQGYLWLRCEPDIFQKHYIHLVKKTSRSFNWAVMYNTLKKRRVESNAGATGKQNQMRTKKQTRDTKTERQMERRWERQTVNVSSRSEVIRHRIQRNEGMYSCAPLNLFHLHASQGTVQP